MVSFERFQQNCQAVLAAVSINGLISIGMKRFCRLSKMNSTLNVLYENLMLPAGIEIDLF